MRFVGTLKRDSLVFCIFTDLKMMSYAAEIASSANRISGEKLAIAMRQAEISVLKLNIDVQAQVQLEMAQMLRDVQSHLGSHINVTA